MERLSGISLNFSLRLIFSGGQMAHPVPFRPGSRWAPLGIFQATRLPKGAHHGVLVKRCSACWLPSEDFVCSRRCRTLIQVKEEIRMHWRELEREIISAVLLLRSQETLCPKTLAHEKLVAKGFSLEPQNALACLRELYFSLREKNKLRFYQKGKVIPKNTLVFKGTFHIGR
jgi:hypothetical protein